MESKWNDKSFYTDSDYIYRLTKDFHFNKRIIDDIAVIQSKKMRNKIAGE